MKSVKAITLLILISGCSEDIILQDDRLIPYAQEVQMELASRGIQMDLEVNLVIVNDLFNKADAHGESQGDVIRIDEETFMDALEAGKETRILGLVAHELGHNRLNLRHVNTSDRDKTGQNPKIMIMGEWRWITDENVSIMFDNLAQLVKEKR